MPGPNCRLHGYLGWDEATTTIVGDLAEACWPRLVSWLVWELVEASWLRLIPYLRWLKVHRKNWQRFRVGLVLDIWHPQVVYWPCRVS